MARPKTRPTRAALPADEPLAPTPDNGTPYTGGRGRTAKKTAKPPKPPKPHARDFPQLGTRVPPELMERVTRYCDESGVPRARVVARALERFLDAEGY